MRAGKPKAMVVAGVMSGTSADGVDVALARISPRRGTTPSVEFIGHRGFRYPRAVRAAVLRVMAGEPVAAAEISRLNWRLGEVYAGCVEQAGDALNLKAALVGMHGQTVYHQAMAARYAGATVRATWQIGEAAVLRERLGIPVVSDFRPADLAAGGQAAPLVPMLDYCMFRSARVNRVLLNLGGIANVTVIPAGAKLHEVIAFDTGPANMVIDGLMQIAFGKAFDRGGLTAAKGRVLDSVVSHAVRERYVAAAPPKSCGREQFGEDYAKRFRGLCRAAGGSDVDAVATATEVAAATVIEAYRRFGASHFARGATEVIAAGGGTKNLLLMRRLKAGFAELGVALRAMDELGVPAQAKEAVAFALLGWLSWHGLAGNVPSATGASGARVLGKIAW